jgi:hypothetical protein
MAGIFSWIFNVNSDNLLGDFFISVIGLFLIMSILSNLSVYGLISSFLGIILFFYGFYLLDKADWDGGWGPKSWEKERHSAPLD